MDKKIIVLENKQIEVEFNYEILNIHIKDSYKITKIVEMKIILDDILMSEEYQKLVAAGYTLTKETMLREWRAHNFLYLYEYKRNRTGSVDLNQNESRGRRILYFILSLFYMG
jgi:hypothetical protein